MKSLNVYLCVHLSFMASKHLHLVSKWDLRYCVFFTLLVMVYGRGFYSHHSFGVYRRKSELYKATPVCGLEIRFPARI